MLQAICARIVLIRNVSIISFSVGFLENQRLLVLVWGPGNRVMSSIYWKMNEKTFISEERGARSHFYNAKFCRRYAGLEYLY